jgi:hypothetical protein
VGPGAGLEWCGEEENSYPTSGFESQTVEHVADRYTHWAIPAPTYSYSAVYLTFVFCPQHIILVPAQSTSQRKRYLPFWKCRQEAQPEPLDIFILPLFFKCPLTTFNLRLNSISDE